MSNVVVEETSATEGRRSQSTLLQLLRILLVVLLAQAPALFLIWDQGKDVAKVTSNTNEVVQVVEEQTSPEAVRRQTEAVNGIIVKIDCNNAARFQRVVDGLEEQGLIESFDVLDSCATTTTTTIP